MLQDIRPGPSDQSGLRFVSGIISKSKALRFERMLFRATRGNMLFNHAPADEQIMDPLSTEMVFFCLSIIKFLFGAVSFSVFFLCRMRTSMHFFTNYLHLCRLRKQCL